MARIDFTGSARVRGAHQTIPGAAFAVMEGVGHFPTSENQQRFIEAILPVLDTIEASHSTETRRAEGATP